MRAPVRPRLPDSRPEQVEAGGANPDVQAAVQAVVLDVETLAEELEPVRQRQILDAAGVKQAHGDLLFGSAHA